HPDSPTHAPKTRPVLLNALKDPMRVAVGSDHRGFGVKAKLIELVVRLGHEVEDVGCFSAESVDYPDVAAVAGEKVSTGQVDRAILICGTGIGMCIAANKFAGVR